MMAWHDSLRGNSDSGLRFSGWSLVFGVWGLGFEVWGWRFRVWAFGYRASRFCFRISGLRFGGWVSSLTCRPAIGSFDKTRTPPSPTPTQLPLRPLGVWGDDSPPFTGDPPPFTGDSPPFTGGRPRTTKEGESERAPPLSPRGGARAPPPSREVPTFRGEARGDPPSPEDPSPAVRSSSGIERSFGLGGRRALPKRWYVWSCRVGGVIFIVKPFPRFYCQDFVSL